MAENTKHCGTCKYGYLGPGYEPCKSCGDDCSNWEAQDEVVPIPMDIKHIAIREEKYMYFVSFYCEDKNGNTIMNNCFIERDKKLRTTEDIMNIRDDIKNECNFGNVVILNWKELEG